MVYPKIPLAQSIIEICLAKGIKNIVISSVLPPITSAPGFENPNAFGQHTMTNFNLFEQQLETNEEQ